MTGLGVVFGWMWLLEGLVVGLVATLGAMIEAKYN